MHWPQVSTFTYQIARWNQGFFVVFSSSILALLTSLPPNIIVLKTLSIFQVQKSFFKLYNNFIIYIAPFLVLKALNYKTLYETTNKIYYAKINLQLYLQFLVKYIFN